MSTNPIAANALRLGEYGDPAEGKEWGDSEIALSEMEKRLVAAAVQNPQPEIHIRGARKADYEYVLRAMAMAHRAGILKLGFVTDPV